MTTLRSLTLRQMLTIPYVALVLVTAFAIGGLSYFTGRDAVDTLSDLLLKETVGRISQAVERHLSGSAAVLETAFPRDVPAPVHVGTEVDTLRNRFWLATSMHRDPHNYAYYGDRNGHFFGLWRFSETEAELRLRTDATRPRQIYRFTGIRGPLQEPRAEERVFDPRERPWYKAAQSNNQHTWTSIYVDFKTLELVATRARRVNTVGGEFQGVIATDVSLKQLNTFLKQLKLSANAFAFVVEGDGNLIATSRGPHLKKMDGSDNQRVNAASSDDPLIAATYREVRSLMGRTDAASVARTAVFEAPGGELVQVGYARVQDDAGLDWVIAVAVPRSDFLAGVTANLYRSVWVGLLMALLILVTGFVVLAAVVRDLRQLTQLTRDVGDGVLNSEVNVLRSDELGELARSFSDMQTRLMTDRLTGLANREAFLRYVEEAIIQRRRAHDGRIFAVLFVDLNRFKIINDTHGHDAGDKVLIEMAKRMRTALRGSDFVARLAGDEFVAMLSDVDSREAADTVRHTLEKKLGEPFWLEVGAQKVQVVAGAAIGVARYPADAQDVDSLLKCADADMYSRKDSRTGLGDLR